MLKKLLLLNLILFFSFYAVAQVRPLSNEQYKQMKVDNLSDDQVRQIVAEMKQNNVSISDMDQYARQKGVSDSETAKLKERIIQLGLDKELAENDNKSSQLSGEDRLAEKSSPPTKRTEQDTETEKKRKKIFGAELFDNANLTFEPNLRLATPTNYRLAAGDELIIDVYGYNEATSRMKVSPEGYIRIQNVGPVYVNGLTMEEAKLRIIRQLSTIYSGIGSGQTSVQITLGNIRSIKVLLIGEIERPGSYTVPSLATIANALYVSGGPNINGSFRNIQVIRNGQSIVTFDLYEFLTNGDLTNNIILQDQDIVKVNPYAIRVELSGEVKRPAIYEARENETLQNILDYAGGFTELSFKDKIKAYRINSKEREVINISADEVASFKLKSGDHFFIDPILNRFSNRVSITGAVFRPGNYAIEEGMTLASLIEKADGVKEVAALSRGIIRRLQVDYTPAMVNFNVQDILSGRQNIILQREDSVVIYSRPALQEQYQVKITGEVNNAGSFIYADSMHLEDLVLLAGGLTDAASTKHIEVARRIRNKAYDPADSSRAIILQQDINVNLSSDPAIAGFILQPFDEVTVRSSPTYSVQANVFLEGEVLYNGRYAINTKRERISDIIKRAGGLKPEAYPEGAVLLRKTFINKSDSALMVNKLEVFYNKLQDSANVSRLKSVIERPEQLLGINLSQILQKPGSKYDLLLEEGDIIRIPKKLQTIQVFGEVYFPKKVRFDKSSGFRDFIRGAGGFTAQALKRGSYIVYANGEVKNTRKVLFFNSYPKVKPGAEIYVPNRRERKKLSGPETIGIASGLASIALIVVSILDRIK